MAMIGKLLAAALVLGTFGASHAQAATFVATYSGTVTSGTDAAGVFGNQGQSLTGLDFEVVFTGDTEAGLPITAPGGGGNFGGIGTGDAVASAVLTINNMSYSFDGSYFSNNFRYFMSDGSFYLEHAAAQVEHVDAGVPIQSAVNAYVVAPIGLFPTSAAVAIPLTILTNLAASGSFSIYVAGLTTRGYLSPTQMSMTVAQTPIPGALPLFASALGLGGLLRYRRKRAVGQ